MKFSYYNLKSAAKSGERVGNWKGYPVFAASQSELDSKASGAYFIVFNDDNMIVRRIDGDWYSFGQVSEDGQVSEWDRRKKYSSYHYDTATYEPAAHAVCGKNEGQCDGTAADVEEVVGDVKLGLDIDALLESCRTMTVDSLLEGFNYGLDAKG